jgi:hypothetical protein
MRVLRSFIVLIAVTLSLCSFVFSQDKAPLIAMDPSMAQIQSWLSKAIDKNSTVRSENISDSISKVRFDGCNMSYRIDHEDAVEPSLSRPIQPVSYYTRVTTLAFDLKEMNINGVTLTPFVSKSNMLLLTLPAIDGKQSVKFSVTDSLPRYDRSGFQSTATMTVSGDVAEQVKNKLILAMKVCQAPR